MINSTVVSEESHSYQTNAAKTYQPLKVFLPIAILQANWLNMAYKAWSLTI